MDSPGLFNNAHNFKVDQFNVTIPSSPLRDPLRELELRVATGAIHDSAERCDAPKCHAETRVAVQSDLFSWITEDISDANPQKIQWVTGPAGSGKTAVMGSLSVTCEKTGMLAASFFFSSWSKSLLRRRKTAFIPTLSHQIMQHIPALKNAVESAIEQNPVIFEKTLEVQMEILILQPLRMITSESERSQWPRAIVVDGLDECEAEQYLDPEAPGQERSKEDDQGEILHTLHQAAMDPAFPFRIVVASRPERVFREFFGPQRLETMQTESPDEASPITASFAPTIDLHEQYNADDDIALYLRAKLNDIRRRHNLSPFWTPPSIINLLVDRASGQFIYATTIIRFLSDSRLGDPQTLLKAVLAVKATNTDQESGPQRNPFLHLDALYFHILESCPNPLLAVKWIWILNNCVERHRTSETGRSNPFLPRSSRQDVRPAAIHINQWLQLLDGGAEHVFGTLHSLLKIPVSKNIDASYDFYHKSLLDFLQDPQRCGHLYVAQDEGRTFFWDRYLSVCDKRGITGKTAERASFLGFFFRIQLPAPLPFPNRVRVSPSGAEWWMRTLVVFSWPVNNHIHPALKSGIQAQFIRDMFVQVHRSCHWYGCTALCKTWRRSILSICKSSNWNVPRFLWLFLNRFDREKSADTQLFPKDFMLVN